ncbi:putative ABC transport system permease protein [Borreliella japonica]|uniref:Putative ABC transport system permease protein n=1 Tax=Borreliella japonica TaxID=34095 RepID=A0A1G4Q907_BORJA|nr:FtsX-like permease family protein [Borreliella japonica]SCW41084.1 putative ABC transport system permease protein [Borreliella japonica]
MFKLAFFNIFRDVRRSMTVSFLLESSVVFLLLFIGYMNYSSEGMEMGLVSSTGHIQIAKKNYFNPKFSSIKNNLMLKDCEILQIKNEINKYSEFKSSNLIVNFEGLIGNSVVSKPFFATAFEDLDFATKSLSLVDGNPLFDSSVGDFLIGSNLAMSLGIESLTKKTSKLTLMTDMLGEGLILQDVRLSGIIKFPVIQTDSMVAITSINTLKSFFDFKDGVHVIQVYLKNNSFLNSFKDKLEVLRNKSNIDFEYSDWYEINPSFKSILGINEIMFKFLSILIILLIFISFFQIMTALGLERTRELGTLRAIGLTKLELFYTLFLEIFILTTINIILGIAISYFLKLIIGFYQIRFSPPGYTESYFINFLYYFSDICFVSLFIFLVAIISSVLPFIKVSKRSIVEVINNV